MCIIWGNYQQRKEANSKNCQSLCLLQWTLNKIIIDLDSRITCQILFVFSQYFRTWFWHWEFFITNWFKCSLIYKSWPIRNGTTMNFNDNNDLRLGPINIQIWCMYYLTNYFIIKLSKPDTNLLFLSTDKMYTTITNSK